MAASVSTVTKGRDVEAWGHRRIGILRVTLDASYASGGEAIVPKQYLGFTPQVVIPVVRYASGATGSARIVEFDHTNNKLVVFQQKDPAAAGGADIQFPEAGAIDLSGLVVDLICIGD